MAATAKFTSAHALPADHEKDDDGGDQHPGCAGIGVAEVRVYFALLTGGLREEKSRFFFWQFGHGGIGPLKLLLVLKQFFPRTVGIVA